MTMGTTGPLKQSIQGLLEDVITSYSIHYTKLYDFGQSPFAVPNPIKEALIKNADKGAYAPVPGIPELREAISKYNKHYFGIDADPQRIYVGPGTKELIFNLLEVLLV